LKLNDIWGMRPLVWVFTGLSRFVEILNQSRPRRRTPACFWLIGSPRSSLAVPSKGAKMKFSISYADCARAKSVYFAPASCGENSFSALSAISHSAHLPCVYLYLHNLEEQPLETFSRRLTWLNNSRREVQTATVERKRRSAFKLKYMMWTRPHSLQTKQFIPGENLKEIF
jgi:hypothetical protein